MLALLLGMRAAYATPVDTPDSQGWTPLMRAAMDGDTSEIAALLDKGAQIEASHPKVYAGATPVVIALEFGQHDAAKLLLDRGASIAGTRGTSALELAARDGDDEILDRLLAAKVSPKHTTALHAAAKYGHVSAIQKLIKAGAPVRAADKNDHNYTPFIVACQNRQAAAAKALLAAGANVNDIDADGTPALHWAVFAERPEEIHEYEDLGQPHTTSFVPRKNAPLLKLMLATKGIKKDVVDQDGNTALHQAAMMDAAAAAQLLVAAGVSRTKKNRAGETAYDLAKARNNSVEPILRAKQP